MSPSNDDCIDVGNEIGLEAVTEPVSGPCDKPQLVPTPFVGGLLIMMAIPGSDGGGVVSFGLGGVISVRNEPNNSAAIWSNFSKLVWNSSEKLTSTLGVDPIKLAN